MCGVSKRPADSQFLPVEGKKTNIRYLFARGFHHYEVKLNVRQSMRFFILIRSEKKSPLLLGVLYARGVYVRTNSNVNLIHQ